MDEDETLARLDAVAEGIQGIASESRALRVETDDWVADMHKKLDAIDQALNEGRRKRRRRWWTP